MCQWHNSLVMIGRGIRANHLKRNEEKKKEKQTEVYWLKLHFFLSNGVTMKERKSVFAHTSWGCCVYFNWLPFFLFFIIHLYHEHHQPSIYNFLSSFSTSPSRFVFFFLFFRTQVSSLVQSVLSVTTDFFLLVDRVWFQSAYMYRLPTAVLFLHLTDRKKGREKWKRDKQLSWSVKLLHTCRYNTRTHTRSKKRNSKFLHMRMGFRPLVNMSMPLGANVNPTSIFSSTTTRPFINPFLNPPSFNPDNHHSHASIDDSTDNNDDPDLHVELENKPLWDAFHTHGTEMVSNRLSLLNMRYWSIWLFFFLIFRLLRRVAGKKYWLLRFH